MAREKRTGTTPGAAKPVEAVWSPPVPQFREESWRQTAPPPEIPVDVQAALSTLKAKLETRVLNTQPVDDTHVTRAELTRRYLTACQAKGYGTAALEALGPLPTDDPGMAPAPRAWTRRRLAWRTLLRRTFPVDEWEAPPPSEPTRSRDTPALTDGHAPPPPQDALAPVRDEPAWITEDI